MRTWFSLCVAFGALALVSGLGMAQDAPLTISDVKVELKTNTIGKDKGKQYLRVSFMATANAKIEPKMVIRITGAGQFGAESKSDEIMALGPKLETFEAGVKSKEITAPLFMKEGIAAAPDRLDLKFTLAKTLEKQGAAVGEFCWTAAGVAPGACKAG